MRSFSLRSVAVGASAGAGRGRVEWRVSLLRRPALRPRGRCRGRGRGSGEGERCWGQPAEGGREAPGSASVKESREGEPFGDLGGIALV